MEEKIAVLESQITSAMEKKHWKQFEKQAMFMGNGVYEWRGQYSTDTRELFLLGIAVVEEIEIIKKKLKS